MTVDCLPERAELTKLAEFPVGSPEFIMVKSLREMTTAMRRIKNKLPSVWRTHLSEDDRQFLHIFTTGPSEKSKPSAADHWRARWALFWYPGAVQDFLNEKAELRAIVIRLIAKDVWSDALNDKGFVAASERGMTDIKEGRTQRVSREDL